MAADGWEIAKSASQIRSCMGREEAAYTVTIPAENEALRPNRHGCHASRVPSSAVRALVRDCTIVRQSRKEN
jgi:hypothetical protein